MGEIKSTLDLVLEKTKNLTLSSEEKEAQKKEEIEKRIKGMLQKYQDGILSLNQLKTDYEIFKKDLNISNNNAMINEIIKRLEPDRDNQPLTVILPECCGIDSKAIETNIEAFKNAYLSTKKKWMELVRVKLGQQHGISGSAVVPNLEADEQWRQEIQELGAEFEGQLNQVAAELLVD